MGRWFELLGYFSSDDILIFFNIFNVKQDQTSTDSSKRTRTSRPQVGTLWHVDETLRLGVDGRGRYSLVGREVHWPSWHQDSDDDLQG